MSLMAVTLSRDEASALTERIRSSVDDLWQLLEQAHAGQAWQALGYDTWAQYVNTEFGMSKQHSYRLLDQAHVIRELEAVSESPTGDSTESDPRATRITERQARQIKPRLAEVTEAVRAEPDRLEDIVAEAVEELKAEKAAEKAENQRLREKFLDDVRRNGYRPKVDCPRCTGTGRIPEDEL